MCNIKMIKMNPLNKPYYDFELKFEFTKEPKEYEWEDPFDQTRNCEVKFFHFLIVSKNPVHFVLSIELINKELDSLSEILIDQSLDVVKKIYCYQKIIKMLNQMCVLGKDFKSNIDEAAFIECLDVEDLPESGFSLSKLKKNVFIKNEFNKIKPYDMFSVYRFNQSNKSKTPFPSLIYSNDVKINSLSRPFLLDL